MLKEMFTHRPLSREDDEVRFVRFVPSAEGSPTLSLELKHASLDGGESFSTLSYVWGASENAVEICIDGQPFGIRQNLYHALEQLQRNGMDSWLWVDSICINQDDVEEKSRQVGKMCHIYSQAEPLYIWLGHGTEDTDEAMDFVLRTGPKAHAAGVLDLWHDTKLRGTLEQYIRETLLSEKMLVDDHTVSKLFRVMLPLFQENDLFPDNGGRRTSLLHGIENILQRDYWHRIWVVQEVALPKQAIALCGGKAVQLDWFDSAITAAWHFKGPVQRLELENQKTFLPLANTLYYIPALDIRRRHHRGDQIRIADIVFEYRGAPHRPFYSATDPRDIAFALLGLVPETRSLGLRADYSVDFVDVFTQMTRGFLGEMRSLHWSEFSLIWINPHEENPDHLPSWVPDWRKIGRYGLQPWPVSYASDFKASDGMSLTTTTTLSANNGTSRILLWPGCRVDTIAKVMSPPCWIKRTEWGRIELRDPPSKLLTSICDFVGVGPELSPEFDREWRIATAGVASRDFARFSKKNREAMLPLFHKLLRQEDLHAQDLTQEQVDCLESGGWPGRARGESTKSFDEVLKNFITRFPEILETTHRGKTLFMTANGMLGWGHVAIRSGDMVTLLERTSCPIILRSRGSPGYPEGFEFLGDAYVDGIMYGEFLKEDPTMEVFDIH